LYQEGTHVAVLVNRVIVVGEYLHTGSRKKQEAGENSILG
jgi:hypothetical protein